MSKGKIGIKNLIDLYDVVNSVYHNINTHLYVICIMYNVPIYYVTNNALYHNVTR